MKVINFAETHSILNQYVAELRDVNIQTDRMRFRRNIERIGELMAYEMSDDVVIATVFRAGLPLHQGFLNVFDRAGNAFVSAYRYYSVTEIAEEGTQMHHCVFANAYYRKANSLIMSATIDGKRIETVEVDLQRLCVVHSRGVCNQNTEYHDRIVNLVNGNMNLIRQRISA